MRLVKPPARAASQIVLNQQLGDGRQTGNGGCGGPQRAIIRLKARSESSGVEEQSVGFRRPPSGSQVGTTHALHYGGFRRCMTASARGPDKRDQS